MRYATTSLATQFKKINTSAYPDVTKYENALEAGLWVLWVYSEFTEKEPYLNATQISEILDALGISFGEIEITKAFARAGKKINRKSNGKTRYKIMLKGKAHLEELAGADKVEVIYVQGNKPRTDRKKFEDVISKTQGLIKIVDKFYSRESLDVIERFANSRKIQWLTAELSSGEDETSLKRELSRFRSEYKNVEIKKHAKAYELHDRYLITDDALILFGHGLIDLGRKESFILVFKETVGKEIRSLLETRFEEKWRNASNLK